MNCCSQFQELSFNEFSFSAERYKDYVGGYLIYSGFITSNLVFKQHKKEDFKCGLISVQIQHNPFPDKILSSFEFDRCVIKNDRLIMYSCANQSNVLDTNLLIMASLNGFTREKKEYKNNEPTVCEIISTNKQIVRVTFKLVNPERFIEFY